LSEDLTIEEILKKTGNYPKFALPRRSPKGTKAGFFVQVGGGAAGAVLNSKQLNKSLKQIGGLGSIVIHRLDEDPIKLFKAWIKFFRYESCGQCVPCREGNYRLLELLEQPKVDWPLFKEILFSLKNTSFCGLGSVVPHPIMTYWENIKDFSK